jgi:hypothetical protein
MNMLGFAMFAVMGVGMIFLLVGWIKMLILMFNDNILWGLGGFFIGTIALIVYAIMNWEKSKSAFLWHMGGLAVFSFGMIAFLLFNLS